MKKQAYSLLAVASLLATVLVASAQAQSDSLIAANIPFNFVIKDRAFPAGEYTLTLVQVGGSDAVRIQSADGHITAFVPTHSASAKANAEPKLVFDRYDDQYFLAQVFGLEDTMMRQLARPRAEDALAKSAAERSKVSVAARKR